MGDNFNQKRINHIFHYTKTFDRLHMILKEGFAPSYCEENITNLTYLIPMVSYCNISIREVDLYMRYGYYGIGMSVEWAVNRGISPVIYIHENSPFNNLHRNVNEVLLWDMVSKQMADAQKQFEEAVDRGDENNFAPVTNEDYGKLLMEINQITVPALQFFKNWKVDYDGHEIITYQEREWRYVPALPPEGRIIISTDQAFKEYSDKEAKPKPHLPDQALGIESISDIRYLIVRAEEERKAVIGILKKKFGEKNLLDAVLSGELTILTDIQVKNDF